MFILEKWVPLFINFKIFLSPLIILHKTYDVIPAFLHYNEYALLYLNMLPSYATQLCHPEDGYRCVCGRASKQIVSLRKSATIQNVRHSRI